MIHVEFRYQIGATGPGRTLVAIVAGCCRCLRLCDNPVQDAPACVKHRNPGASRIHDYRRARISGDVRTDYEQRWTYLEQGRHEEGIALLEAVADEAPQLSAPRIDLGIAYHRAGDLEAAEDESADGTRVES